MPLYDYQCQDCGQFEVMRRMADREAPVHCPQCGAAASRLLVAPSFASMSTELRVAHSTNERARHEPKRSGGHVHGPGCGCGSSTGKSATVKAPDGSKAFPTKRPWMISH
ncbi:FmdB family zinc ribbon protein [Uliginosibacterium sp. H1]|uniref:FmdB family zinc ribbon protein n=1 Tax=Uliginosibacterium sp. H1 TaxID=3114757 RepID=UPI002E179A5F|nr:zinc ribbon domain-containing protein [Uliginosibacterium sp. H1]